MAQKRMFSKLITNDDNFLEMPCSSQVLYFHLSMNADDDGFVNNWKSIMRMTGTKEDDLKVLITKQYVIPFDSGVIVIRHWRLNNYLQKDRTVPTQYQEELKKLQVNKNNVYEMYTNCIHSIDKNSIDKNSIDKNNIYNVEDIIAYLNKKLSTNYKTNTKSTVSKIKARLKEGFTVEDFKTVIDKKYDEWRGTEMEKYMRPDTLFGTKFESYLNQKKIERQKTFDELLDSFE